MNALRCTQTPGILNCRPVLGRATDGLKRRSRGLKKVLLRISLTQDIGPRKKVQKQSPPPMPSSWKEEQNHWKSLSKEQKKVFWLRDSGTSEMLTLRHCC